MEYKILRIQPLSVVYVKGEQTYVFHSIFTAGTVNPCTYLKCDSSVFNLPNTSNRNQDTYSTGFQFRHLGGKWLAFPNYALKFAISPLITVSLFSFTWTNKHGWHPQRKRIKEKNPTLRFHIHTWGNRNPRVNQHLPNLSCTIRATCFPTCVLPVKDSRFTRSSLAIAVLQGNKHSHPGREPQQWCLLPAPGQSTLMASLITERHSSLSQERKQRSSENEPDLHKQNHTV